MRVSSPIGDLPFEITAVRREGRGLVVEGRLGTWGSEIHMDASDVPMLARALRGPLIAGAALAATAIALRRRR